MTEAVPNQTELDRQFMQKCLELAQEAEVRTAPNPMVGAMVVDREGTIVGSGFHKKSGTAHAEVIALEQAGERAQGATLYVTLEPCCHHGKTPPCSDLVTKCGIKRLVAAMVDPNPKVAGKGIQQIEQSGIQVTMGVLEDRAEWQNRGFLKRVRAGRPWICLKIAATLDGRIADRNGRSKWITGPESRMRVHQLRNQFDAVMVGTNTLIMDDPELTVREITGSRNPVRIGIDVRLQTDPDSRFCTTNSDARTFLIAGEEAIKSKSNVYPGNIELLGSAVENGYINLTSAMKSLAEKGINSVLCEGGARLAGSLISAGLADEVHWVIAPKLLADQLARPALQLDSEVCLAQAWQLRDVTVEKIADDFWLHGIL